MKKCYVLLVLAMNAFVSYAGEKPLKKEEKYDPIKSLNSYIDDLRKGKLLQNTPSGSNLQHGGDYVAIKNNGESARFGRGSSGKSKL